MLNNSKTIASKKRRGGRPPWTPDLKQVRALAAQGMTMDRIADCLGISRTTLFKKKHEFADFADAIKKGSAQGEVVATSKLFEKVKAGAPWAVCFYLKSRCGWRESQGSGAQVDVNILATGMSTETDRARERRMAELSKLTIEERLAMRSILVKAQERMRREKEGSIETDAVTLDEGGSDLDSSGRGGSNGGTGGS